MNTENDIKKMFGDLLHTEQAVRDAARLKLSKDMQRNKGKQFLLGIEIHQVIPAKTGRLTGKKLPDRYELIYKIGVPSGAIYSRILGTFERSFAENLLRISVDELNEKVFAMKDGDLRFKPGLVWTNITFEETGGKVHIK